MKEEGPHTSKLLRGKREPMDEGRKDEGVYRPSKAVVRRLSAAVDRELKMEELRKIAHLEREKRGR